jgi:hypothetical protein
MKLGVTLTRIYADPPVEYFCWILFTKMEQVLYFYGDVINEKRYYYLNSGNYTTNRLVDIEFTKTGHLPVRNILSDFRSMKPTKTFNME